VACGAALTRGTNETNDRKYKRRQHVRAFVFPIVGLVRPSRRRRGGPHAKLLIKPSGYLRGSVAPCLALSVNSVTSSPPLRSLRHLAPAIIPANSVTNLANGRPVARGALELTWTAIAVFNSGKYIISV
jgi:hypothetical protein